MGARINCGYGKSVVEISIDKRGNLVEINFEGKVRLGFGLEDEIIRIIKLTAKNWKASTTPAQFKLGIVFWLKDRDPEMSGDVFVIGYGLPNEDCIKSKKTYQKQLVKYEKRKKYKKALEACKALLKREPEDEELLKKYEYFTKMIETK